MSMTYLINNFYNKKGYRIKLTINAFNSGHMFLIFRNTRIFSFFSYIYEER